MTLKPPTRTLPKLVIKEWPEKHGLEGLTPEVIVISDEGYEKLLHALDNPKPPTRALVELMNRKPLWDDKALSDFTRVVEETGILDQERSQKEKSR